MSKAHTMKAALKKGSRPLSNDDMLRVQYGDSSIYYIEPTSNEVISGQDNSSYVNRVIPLDFKRGVVNNSEHFYSHKMSDIDFQSTFNTESEVGALEREIFSFRRNEELMARVDAVAEACGTTRAKFMRIALHDAVVKNDLLPPKAKEKPRRTLSASLLKSDIDAMERVAKSAGVLKTKCFFYALERAISLVEEKIGATVDTQTPEAAPYRTHL